MSQQTYSLYDQRCNTFSEACLFNVHHIQQTLQLFLQATGFGAGFEPS